MRCSGTAPCRSCTARNQQCVFEEADRRIVVSERHLRDLQRRASALYATHSQTQSVQSPKISDCAVVTQPDAIWGFQEHTNSHVSPLPELSTPLIISDESGKGNNASSKQVIVFENNWAPKLMFVDTNRHPNGLSSTKSAQLELYNIKNNMYAVVRDNRMVFLCAVTQTPNGMLQTWSTSHDWNTSPTLLMS